MGVGPGSSDLLTLRAVEVIRGSQVIICPRSAASRNSLALEIISGFILDQEVIEHVYPMSRNQEEVMDSWNQAAMLISSLCRQGKSVSQVTLGDPHVYSTCGYVLPRLEENLGLDRIHVIPGVTAFQASAANFAQSLVIQEDRLTLMPATDMEEVEKALDCCETLVLYKIGKNLTALCKLLQTKGLENKARMVLNAEMPGKEKVYPDMDRTLEREPGYLACVIVHVGHRSWKNTD